MVSTMVAISREGRNDHQAIRVQCRLIACHRPFRTDMERAVRPHCQTCLHRRGTRSAQCPSHNRISHDLYVYTMARMLQLRRAQSIAFVRTSVHVSRNNLNFFSKLMAVFKSTSYQGYLNYWGTLLLTVINTC